MSFSITGIQAIPQGFLFPGTDHVYGSPSHAKAEVSSGDAATLSAAETSSFANSDSAKTLSSPGIDTTHAAGVPPAKAANTAAPVDTVTLSTVDKVRHLRQQGEGDTQIASALNLPIKEVQSDLHLDAHVPQAFTVAPVSNTLSSASSISVAASA